MYLRTLELEEFRRYRHLSLELNPAGLRLSGANASGKSTLLEAITMLATTRSTRGGSEREVINWESGEELGFPAFMRLNAMVVRRDGEIHLEITLQVDPARPGVARKQIKLNGRPVRAMDAVGALKAVLFSPEDVALISGAPSGRRRFLDLTISQLHGGYLRALARYGKLLTQRNSLLRSLARDRVDPASATAAAQLAYWDEEVVAVGSLIAAHRVTTVRRLGQLAVARFRWLSDGLELAVRYQPSIDLAALARDDDRGAAEIQGVVAREFSEALRRSRRDELRRGTSLIGPHRDDVMVTIDSIDTAAYGSRGQQRLAVLALKLAEADLMTEEAGETPVLLLDDVLSELDMEHRAFLLSALAELDGQVIVTTTDAELLSHPVLDRLPGSTAAGGQIASRSEPEVQGGPGQDQESVGESSGESGKWGDANGSATVVRLAMHNRPQHIPDSRSTNDGTPVERLDDQLAEDPVLESSFREGGWDAGIRTPTT